MNTINLIVEAPLPSPQHSIGCRVALIADCQPDDWMLGTVIGLSYDYTPQWVYIVRFDRPIGITDECLDAELVSVLALPALQNHWLTLEAEVA